jgi:hypothetical protein
VILEPGKKHLFLDISSTNIDTLVPSLYQCVETRSTEVFWLSQPLPHLVGRYLRLSNVLERICRPSSETLYATNTSHVNRKHFFMNILYIESFCPQKTHNRILLLGSSLLKHSHHFDYWNQPLNMRMRVCYRDYHEAGLCCYLVVHIENLLRLLQLFYFHLWPIYWLSLVYLKNLKGNTILDCKISHSVHTDRSIQMQCKFFSHLLLSDTMVTLKSLHKI